MKEPHKTVSNIGDMIEMHESETLDQLFGYHLKRAMNVFQMDLKQTLKPFDLRMLTYATLVMIVENPGLRQSQLAQALEVERPNMVVIIDTLENRALITRDPVVTDRRAHALNATLAGRRLAEQATLAVRAHEERLLRAVPPERRESLIAALALIRATGGGESL